MKRGWLLYDAGDLAVNQDFAAYIVQKAWEYGMQLETVCTCQLTLGIAADGMPLVYKNGLSETPDFVISRQRDALISRHLELAGAVVFNNAYVCQLCNDKRITHQFLLGLPMLRTTFVNTSAPVTPVTFPLVVKPAASHGGDRVQLVRNEAEWHSAMDSILPLPALEQCVASNAGRDLRVYVLFGRIVAGVMRTAQQGIISNYKLGGQVALHTLSAQEEALAQQVIERFASANAPLCFAGIDFLYHEGQPVLSEVEDVVGSRMLYQVCQLDIIAMYISEIANQLG